MLRNEDELSLAKRFDSVRVLLCFYSEFVFLTSLLSLIKLSLTLTFYYMPDKANANSIDVANRRMEQNKMLIAGCNRIKC